MSRLIAVVMAAGHGTRMKSSLPKVLHPACGRPLVYYPVRAALELGASEIVVVVNPATQLAISSALQLHFDQKPIKFAVQTIPQGTGDAARVGLAASTATDHDRVLILSGDTPLLQATDLQPLVNALDPTTALGFMYFHAEKPHGYGRVMRNADGMPTAIVEQRDLNDPSEEAIQDVNAGVYVARADELRSALSHLQPNNAQGEYYLTDIVADIAQHAGVCAVEASPAALQGVNDRSQLNHIEQLIFARIREQWARAGVSIIGEPLIDHSVTLEPDVRVEAGVRLRGATHIRAGTTIDVGSVVTDTMVDAEVLIKPYCVIVDSVIGRHVQLGPFAHLRPGTVLEAEAHIGNFVETKNTLVKSGAKANHLAYLGDAEVGERANLGAGTIICNYDGFRKRRTIIGEDAFVGSDSQLIAPVRIGARAYVATGTTVSDDVPDGALAIGRTRQVNKENYADLLRERLRVQADHEKDGR